jgi:hypothetical protein
MKNPFELIREIEFGSLDRNNKNSNENISSIENFILWIVGFAVTMIGLIISNIEKLKLVVNFTDIQTILVLLALSLFFGVFNRYSIFRLRTVNNLIENFIRLSLSNFDFPEIKPDDLDEGITFDELIDRFKLDYDLDYNRYFEDYNNFNEFEKIAVLEDLKLRHREIAHFLRETYQDGLENVRNIYKIAYGLSEKKSRELFYMQQKMISKKFKLWLYFVELTFIFCNFLFFISILILVLSIF